ncbi:hypothetical protein [Synechococcus sp. MW101C3]|uniref:hypothetical protein n=1 Tax=Synechococcus sp. MW101C3 TaxID=210768 RepID=UPI0011817CE9|nr:hypothetical protein [Synechococcus sp. MW101C3]
MSSTTLISIRQPLPRNKDNRRWAAKENTPVTSRARTSTIIPKEEHAAHQQQHGSQQGASEMGEPQSRGQQHLDEGGNGEQGLVAADLGVGGIQQLEPPGLSSR